MRIFQNSFTKFIVLRVFVGFILAVLFSEYFIYYFIQLQCRWPYLSSGASLELPVHAMLLADTHLLGPRKGHWWDKLRREWQMHRAFQTAITLHRPEVVFFLGDLFDEGQWSGEKEFGTYVDRFHSLFKVPDETKMYVVVGNHDIGFHYKITPYMEKRFEKSFDAPPLKNVSIRGNNFVLINSMGMEGDGCFLCSRAMAQLDEYAEALECSRNWKSKCKEYKLERYSRPIIMQHFPLYRESDEVCTESDAAPLPDRLSKFAERWDCLSRESTDYLVHALKPRVVFGGHTHHSCFIQHNVNSKSKYDVKFTEYSVPSFSWRNRLDPKYLLVTFSPDEYKVSKCAMPTEVTIITTYCVTIIIFIIFNINKLILRYHRISKPEYSKI